MAEWATGMVRATYMPVINVYRQFEPLAPKFYDDRVRSSVLLNLGKTASRIGDEFSNRANLANEVLSIKDQSSIHGLNPGYAKGNWLLLQDRQMKSKSMVIKFTYSSIHLRT